MATATVTRRTETHEVRVEVDARGMPSIVARPSMREIRPETVQLAFSSYGAGWSVRATVLGLTADGRQDWANFGFDRAHDDHPHDWPEWLAAAADEQHPARPGGWPGDDPEGSYL